MSEFVNKSCIKIPVKDKYVYFINYYSYSISDADTFFLTIGIKSLAQSFAIYFPSFPKKLDSIFKDSSIAQEFHDYFDPVEVAQSTWNSHTPHHCPTIFYTGECLKNYIFMFHNYNTPEIYDKVDLVIDFTDKGPLNKTNHHCLSHGLVRNSRFFNLTMSLATVQMRIQSIEDVKQLNLDRLNGDLFNKDSNFAAMVASHMGKNRFDSVINLQKIGYVERCGLYMNNSQKLKTDFNNNKIEYLRSFVFNICPENFDSPGYCTEKIWDALRAGCIPIYWGSNNKPEPKILNQKRIIFIDDDMSGAMEQISRIINDPVYAQEFLAQPVFVPGAAEYIYETALKPLRDHMSLLGVEYYDDYEIIEDLKYFAT